jgi:hypothetical protein
VGENLRIALAVVTVIAGWALVVSAGYLHYVALPGERTRRHMASRAALAIAGLVLLLLGIGFLP